MSTGPSAARSAGRNRERVDNAGSGEAEQNVGNWGNAVGTMAGRLDAAEFARRAGRELLSRCDPRTGLYGRRRLRRLRAVTLWPHANAWAARCSLAALDPSALPSADEALGAIARYRPAAPADRDGGLCASIVGATGRRCDRYFDDNAWIGLDCLRQHRIAPDPRLVEMASEIAGFVVSGWSEADIAQRGGIYWRETPTPRGRNTCANAPAAALCAELALLGARPQADEWAERIYRWTRDVLRRPDGLYIDHLAPDGALDERLWSYNQGAMVGAGVLLAQLSRNRGFLDDAAETARAALERFGNDAALAREPPAFCAVFFRNLAFAEAWGVPVEWRPAAARLLERAAGRQRARVAATEGDEINEIAAFCEVAALVAGGAPGP